MRVKLTRVMGWTWIIENRSQLAVLLRAQTSELYLLLRTAPSPEIVTELLSLNIHEKNEAPLGSVNEPTPDWTSVGHYQQSH